MLCEYEMAWRGACKQETGSSNIICEEHRKQKCWGGEQAVQECNMTYQFVCGYPTCEKHECPSMYTSQACSAIGYLQFNEWRALKEKEKQAMGVMYEQEEEKFTKSELARLRLQVDSHWKKELDTLYIKLLKERTHIMRDEFRGDSKQLERVRKQGRVETYDQIITYIEKLLEGKSNV